MHSIARDGRILFNGAAGTIMGDVAAIPGQVFADGEGPIPAFIDIIETHQSLVFSIAYHLLHSTPLAEEAAQDVFCRLYQDYHKIKTASHLIHWLRRTTTHRCLDILRESRKRTQVPLDEIEIPGPKSSTEQDPILARTLQRLVAELPPVARAVVVLRYQEDLEPREIALVLDLPVNTVKSRLQRALVVLRGRLASFEEFHHASDRG